jgi:hypothetical protein
LGPQAERNHVARRKHRRVENLTCRIFISDLKIMAMPFLIFIEMPRTHYKQSTQRQRKKFLHCPTIIRTVFFRSPSGPPGLNR